MTVLGPTAFAVLLWGAILAVAVVFAYELYALADEFDLVARARLRYRTGGDGEA